MFGKPKAKTKDIMWALTPSAARLVRLVSAVGFSTEYDTNIRYWIRAGKSRGKDLMKETSKMPENC